jgi:hypothetical protein
LVAGWVWAKTFCEALCCGLVVCSVMSCVGSSSLRESDNSRMIVSRLAPSSTEILRYRDTFNLPFTVNLHAEMAQQGSVGEEMTDSLPSSTTDYTSPSQAIDSVSASQHMITDSSSTQTDVTPQQQISDTTYTLQTPEADTARSNSPTLASTKTLSNEDESEEARGTLTNRH